MNIVSFFTNDGVPETGLSPTIRIRNASTGALVVTDEAMTEVGDGFYRYDFTGYDAQIDYTIRSDGGVSLADAERYVYGSNQLADEIDDLTADVEDIIPIIESQRGAHTGGGQILYVDPVSGASYASGARGGRSDPFASVQDCHDNMVIDSNHDIVILVPGDPDGATTLTEDVTLSKRYTFFRGPGRDFLWTRSGAGDTISITGDGIELSGFQLSTDTLGAGHGVDISASDFAAIRKVWINYTRGDAINVSNSESIIIEDNVLDTSGAGGSGHGITINPAGGDSSHVVIRRNHIASIVGNGIRVLGGTVDHSQIYDNQIHDCTGWGISIGVGVTNSLVARNLIGDCGSGDIEDLGTDTVLLNNEQWASHTAGDIWDESLVEHTTPGTFGQELATKADIVASTSTIFTVATSGSVIYGTEAGGTWQSTQNRDDTYWNITESVADGLTVDLTYYIPELDRPGAFILFGRKEGTPGGTHGMSLWAYNYEASAYESLVGVFMPGGTNTDDEYSHAYYERNVDRFNNNEVKLRLIHNVTSYIGTHNLYIDSAIISSIAVITAEDIADAVWSKELSGGRSAEYVILDNNESLKRALGLMHENIFIDQPGYDINSNLISARVRIYSDSASVGTANNVIGTYQITSDGTGRGQFANWKQVKV